MLGRGKQTLKVVVDLAMLLFTSMPGTDRAHTSHKSFLHVSQLFERLNFLNEPALTHISYLSEHIG